MSTSRNQLELMFSERASDIVRMIESGMSFADIATKVGVHKSTLSRRFGHLMPPRMYESPKRRIVELHRDNIVRMNSEGVEMKEIAAMLGVSYGTVRKVIGAVAVRSSPSKDRVRAGLAGVRSMIVDSRIPQREVAAELGVSPTTLHNVLREQGHPTAFLWSDALDICREDIVQRHHSGESLLSIARRHGCSDATLGQQFRRWGVDVVHRPLRRSAGELEMTEYIGSLAGGECTSRKWSHNGQRYEIDCFVPSASVGFEYHGEFWHSFPQRPRMLHRNKYLWAKRQGISLVQFFEHEWKERRDVVQSMIAVRLGKARKLHARDCRIEPIDEQIATAFHRANHLHGAVTNARDRTHYGLIHHTSGLVGVASICRARFGNADGGWEILRMSFAAHTLVVGGGAKLIKHIVKSLPPQSTITSFADLRFGEGNVYTRAGFVRNPSDTAPGYFYWDANNNRKMSRHDCQKHKLPKLLGSSFDAELSERENMARHRVYPVYDAGHARYSLRVP